jgi:hypothetical protein
MASYYKFAERQADSFVNWAEIGKGITDMIQTEVSIRDQKKAAIDQATRDNLKEVAEAPVGSHEGLNTWTLNYADSAREAILLQDRLLKSGGLKLKDYTIMRQNLNDGTDELFGVIKNFQNTYKEKRDRLISSDPKNRSQQIEMDLLAYTEQFGDFSKSMAIIDPRNFTVNVGLMEPDPNNQGVMKVGKQIATTSFLRKIQDTKVDYFDADAAADSISKSMGKYVRATIAEMSSLQGKVITKEGFKNSPDYKKIIKTSLKSVFSNPFNMTSILTENLVQDEQGRPYVSSISGKEGNVIELKFNPAANYYEPELNKEQEDAVINYMTELIDFRIDDVIKEDPFNKPQPNVGRREDEPASSGGNYAENINQFKTKLKTVPPKRGATIFTGTGDITTQNIQGLLNSDPALIGKFKVGNAENVITVTDNDDVVIGTFDLSKAPPTQTGIKQREKYLEDLIELVTNYSISKDPTSIGVSLMTGQQSGGASQFNPKP